MRRNARFIRDFFRDQFIASELRRLAAEIDPVLPARLPSGYAPIERIADAFVEQLGSYGADTCDLLIAAVYRERPNRDDLSPLVTALRAHVTGAQRPTTRPRRIEWRCRGVPHELICHFAVHATIGRSSECDFRFSRAPRSVSSTHALIRWDAHKRQYLLSDTNSVNGTYFQDKRLASETAIEPNSTISLARELSLNTQFNRSAPTAGFALVHNDDGQQEVGRYVMAPNGTLAIGNTTDCVGTLPYLPAGYSIAAITTTPEGLRITPHNCLPDGNGSALELTADDRWETRVGSLTLEARIS